MTKKHFIRAAQLVSELVEQDGNDCSTARLVAATFIALFREFNPRFDTQRFLRACGL